MGTKNHNAGSRLEDHMSLPFFVRTNSNLQPANNAIT